MHSESQKDGGSDASGPSRLELVQKALFEPFTHNKRDSTRILSDLAPVIMTPRMIHSASTHSSRTHSSTGRSSTVSKSKVNFATLCRTPLRLGLGSKRVTYRDLEIVQSTDELLGVEVPEPEGVASDVSLLQGFNATIPSADKNRSRRRQLRHVETPRLGLRKLGMSARGLMTEEDQEVQGIACEEDIGLVKPAKSRKRRGRDSLSTLKTFGREELARQMEEIQWDKENIHVKRSLIHSEIAEITNKIEALDNVKGKLQHDLLLLQEEELELDDELLGVKERSEFEKLQSSEKKKQRSSAQTLHLPASSRRRKGPAFLPSEHDELPPGVAFMTLESHTTPLTTLDFSEPYGTLVSASQEDAQPRVWDLFSGTEMGRLRGHRGTVKCLQVEDRVCLTGGEDGNVRLWDLRRVEGEDTWSGEDAVSLSDVDEEGEYQNETRSKKMNATIRNGQVRVENSEKVDPCVRSLEGHSRAVTALFFEDECLVTGASDKTLRQWDLTTGQCVMTMDILWAISHPSRTTSSTAHSAQPYPFGFQTSYCDGAWDTYEDFVGGVQFWGYGLVSGSADGAVRMWDMRTGQTHRTLTGHTAPISCLQFDEIHIASGSLDKTIRIWDLRTGGTLDTIKFNHAVSSLQFDTRKVIATAGENGIKVYNRTTTQQTTLVTNGHMQPVECVRYMDRYLISGGQDSKLKIWSL